MKRSAYFDIVLLLGFLLLLSAGASLLAHMDHKPINNPESISDSNVLAQVAPLFMARNVKKIAEYIAQRPLPQQIRLVTTILDDQKNPLTAEDKIKVVLELSLKTQNRNHRVNLYTTLIENDQVASQKPFLYIAAATNYDAAIPSIADWLVNHTDIFDDWFYKALMQTIKENKPEIALKLLSRVTGLTSANATKLLWEVIKEKRKAEFVAPLILKGANPNDVQGGKTPLILAAQLNQMPLVIALLDNGALVNKMIDPAIGSALQTAIRNKNAGIEMILRSKGAVE